MIVLSNDAGRTFYPRPFVYNTCRVFTRLRALLTATPNVTVFTNCPTFFIGQDRKDPPKPIEVNATSYLSFRYTDGCEYYVQFEDNPYFDPTYVKSPIGILKSKQYCMRVLDFPIEWGLYNYDISDDKINEYATKLLDTLVKRCPPTHYYDLNK